MIYDHNAAFQRGMINLFWEHFTSTSLTHLGLALTCARSRLGEHVRHARAHTDSGSCTLYIPDSDDINAGQSARWCFCMQFKCNGPPFPHHIHTHTHIETNTHTALCPLFILFFFFLLLTPVVQWLTFPCLLSCLIHSSQRFHRCSHPHMGKETEERGRRAWREPLYKDIWPEDQWAQGYRISTARC